MKKLGKLLVAGLVVMGFWACSEEVEVPGDTPDTKETVYMQFSLELPTMTRSATEADGTSDENPDTEEGLDKENTVSDVVVVLAKATTTNGLTSYTYVTHSTEKILGGAKSDYVATFESKALKDYVNEGNASVCVFVICNPPTGFNAANLFTNESAAITTDDLENQGGIASANNFLMANAKITLATLPTTTDALKAYNSPANAYPLGTVEVERVAARLDFRPWGDKVNDTQNTDNKYTVEGTVETPTVQIELTDMALVNLSKSYYYLRRVAAATDATATGEEQVYDPAKMIICGAETKTNFVIDVDAATKQNAYAALTDEAVGNFLYPLGRNASVNLSNLNLAYASLATIAGAGGQADNWNTDDYYVWRYATENTLPSVTSQVYGLSTAVIFKGIITETETDGTKKRLNGTNAVYVLDNILYGSWEQVAAKYETIKLNSTTDKEDLSLKDAYEAAVATMATGATEPEKTAAAKIGFSVYSPNTEGKYEVYYYYINRHNDNGTPTQMGVMEFAVVRNNVYKLTVEDIMKFGHPGDPAGDPDPIDPNDPDETPKLYFKVGVKVLPWTVRVNKIEF